MWFVAFLTRHLTNAESAWIRKLLNGCWCLWSPRQKLANRGKILDELLSNVHRASATICMWHHVAQGFAIPSLGPLPDHYGPNNIKHWWKLWVASSRFCNPCQFNRFLSSSNDQAWTVADWDELRRAPIQGTGLRSSGRFMKLLVAAMVFLLVNEG